MLREILTHRLRLFILYIILVGVPFTTTFSQIPDSVLQAYKTQIKSTKDLSEKNVLLNEAIKKLKAAKDTSHLIEFYFTKGKSFFHRSKLDTALVAYTEALRLAELSNDTIQEAVARLSLGNTTINAGQYDIAEQHLGLAYESFKIVRDTQYISDVLNSFGILYKYRGMLAQADDYMNESLSLIKSTRTKDGKIDSFRIARYLTNLGNNAISLGRFVEANNYLKEAEDMMNTLFDCQPHRGKVFIYSALASNFKRLGIYELAITYAKKCRETALAVNYKRGENMFNKYMSDIFIKIEEFDQAEIYIQHLVDELDQMLPKDQVVVYSQLGVYNTAIERYVEAEKWFKKVVEIRDSLGQSSRLKSDYQLMGEMYGKAKNYEKGEKYISLAANMTKEAKDERWPLVQFGSLGYIQLENGMYKEAINNLLIAERTAQQLFCQKELYDIDKYLAEAYQGVGNTDKALEYMIKVLQKDKEFNSSKLAITMAEANSSYQVDELSENLSDINFDLLEKQLELKNQKDKNRRIFTWLAFICFIGGGLIWYQLKKRKDEKAHNIELSNFNLQLQYKNELLAEQSFTIEEQNQTLAKHNIELSQSLQLKQNELRQKRLEQDHFITLNNKRLIKPLTILFIETDEAMRNNIRIYSTDFDSDTTVRDRQTLSGILKKLPPEYFVRVSKSKIVNIKQIKEIRANDLLLTNDRLISISPNYKTTFQERYENLNLN